jgi:hypothetical protein
MGRSHAIAGSAKTGEVTYDMGSHSSKSQSTLVHGLGSRSDFRHRQKGELGARKGPRATVFAFGSGLHGCHASRVLQLMKISRCSRTHRPTVHYWNAHSKSWDFTGIVMVTIVGQKQDCTMDIVRLKASPELGSL